MNQPVKPSTSNQPVLLSVGQRYNLEKDKVSAGGRQRCCWEVLAGVLPGTAMMEYTKRWFVASETFYAELERFTDEFVKANPGVKSTFETYRDEAYEYAKSITHPAHVNWVRIEFVYY